MRVIVHTGKGGVGKTSISAATALRCAELGLKTIVISTDTAHSLGDAYDKEIGPEPVLLAPNLWAQEIDARYSMDKYWGKVQTYMAALFSRQGVEDVVAEEVTILPGLEEGASLLWINEYFSQNEYDVLIVDAAPTAETIRLLSLPDVTRWWLERFLRLTRGIKVVKDTVKSVRNVFSRKQQSEDEEDADAWDQVEKLFDMLEGVRQLLTNPEFASMRLVVNPERMVIKETQRTYTYLNLYGYATDAVLVNRLIPEQVTDPFFDGWKQRQKTNLQFVTEAFGGLPVLTAPMFGEEMGGLEGLRRLADTLYGDKDPSQRLFDGQTHRIEKVDNATDGTRYVMHVPLGFASKDNMDLYRSRDEITLRVGPYRRNIVLPAALHDLELEAKFEAPNLHVRFFKADDTTRKNGK
ncbi:MAG: ArsA family ATPase [Anaerolineae bacterium]|nr:ArsA family ATPase [Anaerolineae bacterium]